MSFSRLALAAGAPPVAPVAGSLSPSRVVRSARSASNPTLNVAGAAPESWLLDGGTYYQCYTRAVLANSPIWTVCLASATSAEPAAWTDLGTILTTGSQPWEEATQGVIGAWLMKVGATYYLFYGNNTGPGTGIGYATASVITGPYTKAAANPVLRTSASGWDSLRCHEPSVIVDGGGTWWMAFMAENVATSQGTTEQIGVASAPGPDGPWTKSTSNPVIPFGTNPNFDLNGTADPSWYYDGTYYWLWFTGLYGAFGARPWAAGLAYATTPDGPFTRHPANPVIFPKSQNSWEVTTTFRGALLLDSGAVHALYSGTPVSASAGDETGCNAVLLSSALIAPSGAAMLP